MDDTSINNTLNKGMTKQMIVDISSSSKIKEGAHATIMALVTRQREMETTFKNRMDHDFNRNSKESITIMEDMMTKIMDTMK